MIDWGGVNSSRRFTLSHLERDIAAVANDLRADLDQLLFEAPVKARNLLPAAVEIRAGDVTDPGSFRAAVLGACRAIFFVVGRHRRSWRSRLLRAGKPDPRGDI